MSTLIKVCSQSDAVVVVIENVVVAAQLDSFTIASTNRNSYGGSEALNSLSISSSLYTFT